MSQKNNVTQIAKLLLQSKIEIKTSLNNKVIAFSTETSKESREKIQKDDMIYKIMESRLVNMYVNLNIYA